MFCLGGLEFGWSGKDDVEVSTNFVEFNFLG